MFSPHLILKNKLENDLHKWLYVLKNIADLNQLPRYLNKPIFEKLFQIAEYSNLNKREKQMYDVSLKRKWDEYSLLTSAESRGIQKGRLETIKQNAQNMLSLGLDLNMISKVVDLPVDEVKKRVN
ncbi:PD-(D/E)XK nuclease family transposase [Lonepinella sp. BR2271]|uniref:PD-(D/E)XK nuclease family transposase n=1 Tax=Lonepinella sp. BR2271 TaxID=3434550 RepID=UPI003F6DA6AD